MASWAEPAKQERRKCPPSAPSPPCRHLREPGKTGASGLLLPPFRCSAVCRTLQFGRWTCRVARRRRRDRSMRNRWSPPAPGLPPLKARESRQKIEVSFWSPRTGLAAERYPRPEIYGGTRRLVFLPRRGLSPIVLVTG